MGVIVYSCTAVNIGKSPTCHFGCIYQGNLIKNIISEYNTVKSKQITWQLTQFCYMTPQVARTHVHCDAYQIKSSVSQKRLDDNRI